MCVREKREFVYWLLNIPATCLCISGTERGEGRGIKGKVYIRGKRERMCE